MDHIGPQPDLGPMTIDDVMMETWDCFHTLRTIESTLVTLVQDGRFQMAWERMTTQKKEHIAIKLDEYREVLETIATDATKELVFEHFL